MKHLLKNSAWAAVFLFASAFIAPSAHADTIPVGSIDNFNIATGTTIQTTADLNVRAVPSKTGAFISVKPRGSRGTVVAGPVSADGYLWYKVNYEIGQSGWNVANWLARISTTTISTGASTAHINSFTASPANPATVTEGVTLNWDTTGVNRCWLNNSTSYAPISDINPMKSSYVVTPAWKIDATHNRAQIVYTLSCLDTMATNTSSLITATTILTLGTSSARVFATTSVDNLNMVIGDLVQVSDPLNVRATPSVYGAFLGVKPAGSRGVIASAAEFHDGRYWYFVNYEVGVDGWNAANWLAKRLSTSTIVTTYATATISSFTVSTSSVTATTTPVTFNWVTSNTLRCTLSNSADLSLPPIVDNAPTTGKFTVVPSWHMKGANSTSITYTLRCQDKSAAERKLVEQKVTVTYKGTVKTSGQITAVNLKQSTPLFSGTAYGTDVIGFTITNRQNVVVYTAGDLPVVNNQWSKTLVDILPAGKYTIKLNANNSTELSRRSFSVATSTASSVTQ